MNPSTLSRWGAVAALAGLVALPAAALTRPVYFNTLTGSATVTTPFLGGDTLFVDTLVTDEVGALTQTVTFTVGSGVTDVDFRAAWEVSPTGSTGPRLVGVNIDVTDFNSALVFSDSFQGVLGGFAISNFLGALGPGTYTLRSTGTAINAASLDVSLNFIGQVPEPQSFALMLAGLGALGFVSARRRRD